VQGALLLLSYYTGSQEVIFGNDGFGTPAAVGGDRIRWWEFLSNVLPMRVDQPDEALASVV